MRDFIFNLTLTIIATAIGTFIDQEQPIRAIFFLIAIGFGTVTLMAWVEWRDQKRLEK